MPAPDKIVTAEAIVQKPEEKPPLTEKQVEALDRDGDGKAGGSLKAGEVLKQGRAPEAPAAKKAGDLVIVRITKTGHDQVHDGEGGRYQWQAEIPLPLEVAQALEGRSYAEIIG